MVKSQDDRHGFCGASELDLEAVCELIQSAKDECSLLRSSAGSCADAQLNELLMEISNERGMFAFELEGCVERHGVNPAVKTGDRSPFDRAIAQLRMLVRMSDPKALLEECAHQEAQILRKYGRVMRQPAPADVWTILKRQYERIRFSRSRLRHWLEQNQGGPLPC